MKDCKGNEFGVGSELRSIEAPKGESIQCVSILGDVASFRRNTRDEEFRIDQNSLTTMSKWVIVDEL